MMDQPDMEKVVERLECCLQHCNDLLVLLKEQTIKKPKIVKRVEFDNCGHRFKASLVPVCPKCDQQFIDFFEKCPKCGQAVKWDD